MLDVPLTSVGFLTMLTFKYRIQFLSISAWVYLDER